MPILKRAIYPMVHKGMTEKQLVAFLKREGFQETTGEVLRDPLHRHLAKTPRCLRKAKKSQHRALKKTSRQAGA